jgi:hypothetical protein
MQVKITILLMLDFDFSAERRCRRDGCVCIALGSAQCLPEAYSRVPAVPLAVVAHSIAVAARQQERLESAE